MLRSGYFWLTSRLSWLSGFFREKPEGSILLLCILAGTALGLFVVPRAPRAHSRLAPAPALIFLDRPLSAAGKADPGQALTQQARDIAREYLNRTFTVTVPGSMSMALPLSKWGIFIDEARLQRLIEDSLDPSSAQQALWRSEQSESSAADGAPTLRKLPLLVEIDREKAAERLGTLKEAVDRPPEAARFDVATQTVVPHAEGRTLDLVGTMLALLDAATRSETKVEARVIITPPHRRADELARLSFPKVLGHFETRYSQAEKALDRTFNLRLAAQRLSGTVLFPGEEFDFNAVVGARDEAHGYKVATVIADGELVDGIGGGTCQISGTLHGAAFFAGLEIVERYPHTRPSSYIKMGMDATVVYPTINFRFKNGFDFPIVVHEKVEGGRVYAEIRGGQVDQVVSMIRKIDAAIPYEQIERTDPQLSKGTRILAQRGVPGFRLHRYRTIRRGSHTTRERWRDVYPPTAQVIRIGTGEATAKRGQSVGVPEYTADEVLILTLTRGPDGAPGEFAENREPGQFGEAHWTERAGMPFWSGD